MEESTRALFIEMKKFMSDYAVKPADVSALLNGIVSRRTISRCLAAVGTGPAARPYEPNPTTSVLLQDLVKAFRHAEAYHAAAMSDDPKGTMRQVLEGSL